MATAHTPPPAPLSVAPSNSTNEVDNKCIVCEDIMVFDVHECFKISTCGHIFHRSCIEQSLSTSANCPTCKLSCELGDLRKYTSQPLISIENTTQTDPNRKKISNCTW